MLVVSGFLLFDFFLFESSSVDDLLFPDEIRPAGGPELDPQPVLNYEFPKFPGIPVFLPVVTEFLEEEFVPDMDNKFKG